MQSDDRTGHNGIERRVTAEGCELRAEERSNGDLVLHGYAVRFGQRSVDMGGWTETVEPGAFTAVLQTAPDVRCLYNHDPSIVLGRTKSGTLTLVEDSVGLRMECRVPNTAQGRPIFESVKRGDVSGQSFSFRISPDGEATWNDDFTERRVVRVAELFDVGPVTYPAYPSTDVATRSRDESMRAAEAKRTAPDGAKGGKATQTNQQRKPEMTPTEKRAQAAKLAADAQKLIQKGAAENRDSTTEERADAKTMLDSADALVAQADIEDRAAAAVARSNEPEKRTSAPPAIQPREPEVAINRRVVAAVPRSFKPALFGTIERANEAAFRSGMWALATLFGNERAQRYCNEHGIETRAQGGSINAKGGYLVPTEMSTAVVNLMETYGIARANCRVFQMNSDTLNIPIRSSGLTAYPIGEADAPTESDKDWTVATLIAKKWGVLVRYSSEVAEDAVISVADDLAMEVAHAYAYAEDNALLKGDGSGTFHGIKGIEDALAAGSKKIPSADHDEFSEITAGDIGVVIGLLPSYAKAGAKIFCSPAVKGAVFDRLLQAAGGNTAAMLSTGTPGSYAGLPIVTSPLLNSTDGASKVVALIGDMAQAVAFGDRRAMTMRMSADRYLEYDQIGILATERFDINVHQVGTSALPGPLIQFSTYS